ncbi:MAG: hypothetical protein AVDCRST_MAG70-1231 [uncultured Thermomicrobiales bacterium]|uniref:Uncharacterized protein n=1 Tax=uncultured Thermomicrobiales bacterium TaxID=1645740 RepID=A0A6J4USP4_9BACT|nr:MAG: hypothetical protein AVDCRST_MAG70-1231 [uncultured Thermomicrobiales bacterium]
MVPVTGPPLHRDVRVDLGRFRPDPVTALYFPDRLARWLRVGTREND